jgi:aminopeptidase N
LDQVESQKSDGNLFIFEECPPISTYIYSLAAGHYQEIVNESAFKVPMKIMCRSSKVKYVDAAAKFKLIEESIKFFETFFSFPFPFKKYD